MKPFLWREHQLLLASSGMLHLAAAQAAGSDDDEGVEPGAAVKLKTTEITSPPPPPHIDYQDVANKAQDAARGPMSQLLVQLVATSSVIVLIACCMIAFRCWRAKKLKAFLAQLPDASEDGQWLVVAYEWGGNKIQSGRMPLDTIVRAAPYGSPATSRPARVTHLCPGLIVHRMHICASPPC